MLKIPFFLLIYSLFDDKAKQLCEHCRLPHIDLCAF